jgi:hypothetical protein
VPRRRSSSYSSPNYSSDIALSKTRLSILLNIFAANTDSRQFRMGCALQLREAGNEHLSLAVLLEGPCAELCTHTLGAVLRAIYLKKLRLTLEKPPIRFLYANRNLCRIANRIRIGEQKNEWNKEVSTNCLYIFGREIQAKFGGDWSFSTLSRREVKMTGIFELSWGLGRKWRGETKDRKMCTGVE